MSEDVAATDNFENSVRVHPSIAQVRTIVEFMKKHPDLAQRKNGLGTQKFKKLWLHLSNTINAMDGAFKSTKGWIKYWNDKRKSVILKNRQILQGKLADTLSPLDKHILEVCDSSTFVMKKTKAVKEEPCNGDDFNNDDPSDEPIRSDEDDWELSRLKNKRLHSDTEERYTTLMEKLVPNTSTPRAIFPSREQQETLLDFLEERQWLAMGYFRTSHARDTARSGWQQIATKLNSDGRGAVKTWQQWAKYWKDKKSAVKRKTSQINLARQQTGGAAADCMVLSTTEERILALLGGEQFALGDAQLRVHPSHQETFGSPGSEQAQPLPPQELEVIHSNIQDPLATDSAGASDMVLPVTPEHYTPEPGPSTARITEPAPPASHNSSPNYRRRRVLPRLRRLHSGPSQRHNLLGSFLDRVTAMEERRLDMEQRQTENQEELNGILRTISEAWTQQNRIIQNILLTLLNRPNT